MKSSLSHISVAAIRLLQSAFARLPLRLQFSAGRAIGRTLLRRQPRRLAVARTNLELCFPELTEAERETLLLKHAGALGEGIVEAGIAWHASAKRLQRSCRVDGLDLIRRIQQEGRGVLLVCGHFSNIEVSVQSIAVHVPIHGVWRPLGRSRADAVTYRGRLNHMVGLLKKADIRGALKHLRDGGVLTMAFDQADTTPGAVIAPFFGHPATCVDTPARLARSLGCAVVPFFTTGTAGDYQTHIGPELEDLATLEPAAAAAKLNAVLESQIKQQPQRYYWVHRRFKKTLPDCYAD